MSLFYNVIVAACRRVTRAYMLVLFFSCFFHVKVGKSKSFNAQTSLLIIITHSMHGTYQDI